MGLEIESMMMVFSSTEIFQTIFCVLFFSFTISFSLFSLSVFIARVKLWCNCDLCQSFLNSSWTSEYNNLCDWYTHLLHKSPTATIHLHVLNNVITANPDNVEHILKTNFPNYPKGKPFSAILGDLLGNGIFNVDGPDWRLQRKMASLELGSVSIRSYAFDIVSSEVRNRLIPLLSSFAAAKDGAVFDLQDVFRRFSFDSICRFSFGLDPGCLNLSLPESEFAAAFDLASNLSARRALSVTPLTWKLKRFFNVGSERKLREAIRLINVLAKEVIDCRRKMGFSSQNDLLSRFMATIDDDDDYLRDIVISFLLAGRDTVAAALTGFFYLLAENPETKRKIREESDRVMGPTRDLPTFGQLREMHYLQAAVHESMRLYPPVQFDSKFCEEDDCLPDGTFVQKGTRVSYHPYAMGRMDRVWGSDCLEFKPERWLNNNGSFRPENPFKYPVFQAGFRVCLGKELALVEMKSVAVALVRRFDIVAAQQPGVRPRFAPGLTATVHGGLPVMVQDYTPQKM